MSAVFLKNYQDRINQVLENYFSVCQTPASRLLEAMRYSVLAPRAKRLRPALVYAAGKMLGADLNLLDAPAAAVEMIHTYSLIHDDLPAMDNDDLRRGYPTCHQQFDEATAILAGDTLQMLACDILSDAENGLTENQQLACIRLLAKESGISGMAAGQMIDLLSENKKINLEDLIQMHQLKTAAMIKASLCLGAIAAHAEKNIFEILDTFAMHMGLAFQIQDDILDIESSTEILGKTAGKDTVQHKTTFPFLIGLDASKEKAKLLYQTALDTLNQLPGDTQELKVLAKLMVFRKN